MPRFPDPHARLGTVLANIYGAQIVESRQVPWASATFSGARHLYLLRVPLDADLGSELDEREFELPGHILADLVLNDPKGDSEALFFIAEALTVEDA